MDCSRRWEFSSSSAVGEPKAIEAMESSVTMVAVIFMWMDGEIVTEQLTGSPMQMKGFC